MKWVRVGSRQCSWYLWCMKLAEGGVDEAGSNLGREGWAIRTYLTHESGLVKDRCERKNLISGLCAGHRTRAGRKKWTDARGMEMGKAWRSKNHAMSRSTSGLGGSVARISSRSTGCPWLLKSRLDPSTVCESVGWKLL